MVRNSHISFIAVGTVILASVVALAAVAIRMTVITYSIPGAPEGLATTPQLDAWRAATMALVAVVAAALAALAVVAALDHRRRVRSEQPATPAGIPTSE